MSNNLTVLLFYHVSSFLKHAEAFSLYQVVWDRDVLEKRLLHVLESLLALGTSKVYLCVVSCVLYLISFALTR